MTTETIQNIKTLPNNQWAVVTVPMFLSLITGAYKAGFDNTGKVTLKYEDAETESAVFPIEESQRLYENCLGETPDAGWFDLVGIVQREAKAVTK